MNGIMNLNKIDITVHWKTHYEQMHPFRLQPGCAASPGIMFQERGRSILESSTVQSSLQNRYKIP
jgi:hypothetical protein